MVRLWYVLMLLLSLCGCQSAEPPPKHLLICGSRVLLPVLRAIAERFESQHPNVRIDFDAGLSNQGARDTREGLADVGMLMREIRTEETGLVSHFLGRDALVFIVHRDNPLSSIRQEQAVELYSQSYSSWKELGGPDVPVTVVGLTEGRAARTQLNEFLKLEPMWAKPTLAVSTHQQIVQAVADRPGAIGCVSLMATLRQLAEGREDRLERQPIRVLPLAGVMPSSETITTYKYPFVRPAVLVTRPSSSECVRQFVEFALSPDQHDLLRRHGLAPLSSR